MTIPRIKYNRQALTQLQRSHLMNSFFAINFQEGLNIISANFQVSLMLLSFC